MELTKEEMIKIIKNYEKVAGYSICNICSDVIPKGKRVVIHREEANPYRLYKIGAVCLKCYENLLKRKYPREEKQDA